MLRLPHPPFKKIFFALITAAALAGWGTFASFYNQSLNTVSEINTRATDLERELKDIKSTDQVQRNDQLETEIKNINTLYQQSLTAYEDMLKLKEDAGTNQTLSSLFAKVVTLLSNRDYAQATTELDKLRQEITKITQATQAQAAIPPSVPNITEAPSSGYRRQSVTTTVGTFLVDVIAADLNSTRVQVETASDSTCANDCPVAALADYVSRSSGFAGINGPYFCPAEYPSCAGKTNSFDTLIMNKNKVYFNPDNNVYSTVPAIIFAGSSASYTQSMHALNQTGADSVIAAQPQLLSGGQITFGGDTDPKKGSRGSRSFIGTKDSTVYIGVVRSATVAEVAYVLQAMGLQSALNLDSGGSTALYASGRYVAGPGRSTPFGIILVNK